jgi:hypothetical protein
MYNVAENAIASKLFLWLHAFMVEKVDQASPSWARNWMRSLTTLPVYIVSHSRTEWRVVDCLEYNTTTRASWCASRKVPFNVYCKCNTTTAYLITAGAGYLRLVPIMALVGRIAASKLCRQLCQTHVTPVHTRLCVHISNHVLNGLGASSAERQSVATRAAPAARPAGKAQRARKAPPSNGAVKSIETAKAPRPRGDADYFYSDAESFGELQLNAALVEALHRAGFKKPAAVQVIIARGFGMAFDCKAVLALHGRLMSCSLHCLLLQPVPSAGSATIALSLPNVIICRYGLVLLALCLLQFSPVSLLLLTPGTMHACRPWQHQPS